MAQQFSSVVDFAELQKRRNSTISELLCADREAFFLSAPLVRDANVPLRQCLAAMQARHLRTCIVYESADNRNVNHNATRLNDAPASAQGLIHIGDTVVAAERHHHNRNPASSTRCVENTKRCFHDAIRATRSSCPNCIAGGSEGCTCDCCDERSRYSILDMRDVLHFFVQAFERTCAMPLGGSSTPATEFVQSMLEAPCGDVANLSGRNPSTAATLSTPLASLLDLFHTSSRVLVFSCRNETEESPRAPAASCLRQPGHSTAPAEAPAASSSQSRQARSTTPLESPTCRLVGMYSVTDFLRFLRRVPSPGGPDSAPVSDSSQLAPAFGTWTAAEVRATALATQGPRASFEVTVCFESTPLYSAMKLMDASGFSALPIVASDNNRNHCVGVLSVRDLQPLLLGLVHLDNCGAVLNLPVLNYVAGLHQLDVSTKNEKFPFIHVNSDTPVAAVINRIVATQIRRLLLTNAHGDLVGVLSTTDLGCFLASQFGLMQSGNLLIQLYQLAAAPRK